VTRAERSRERRAKFHADELANARTPLRRLETALNWLWSETLRRPTAVITDMVSRLVAHVDAVNAAASDLDAAAVAWRARRQRWQRSRLAQAETPSAQLAAARDWLIAVSRTGGRDSIEATTAWVLDQMQHLPPIPATRQEVDS
jgi:hypothetical protein